MKRRRLEEDRKRYPGIAAEHVVTPIILGHPRTGGTVFHHLVAQDPKNLR
jgi:hypothetical protein